MNDGTCKPALMDLDWGAFFDLQQATFPPFPPFPLPVGYENFCKIIKKIRNFVFTIFPDFVISSLRDCFENFLNY